MQNKMKTSRPMPKEMKISKGTAKRLLKCVTSNYKKELIIVVIAIIISSVANVAGSLFLKTLIDDYI